MIEPNNPAHCMSAKECAEVLGISYDAVLRLVARGALPVLRLGKRVLILRRQLMAQLNQGWEPPGYEPEARRMSGQQKADAIAVEPAEKHQKARS